MYNQQHNIRVCLKFWACRSIMNKSSWITIWIGTRIMAIKQQIYVFFLHVVFQTTPTFEITNQMTCGVERTMLTLFTAASVTVASSPVTPVFCLAFYGSNNHSSLNKSMLITRQKHIFWLIPSNFWSQPLSIRGTFNQRQPCMFRTWTWPIYNRSPDLPSGNLTWHSYWKWHL